MANPSNGSMDHDDQTIEDQSNEVQTTESSVETIKAGPKTELESRPGAPKPRWVKLTLWVKAHRKLSLIIAASLLLAIDAVAATDLKYQALGWLFHSAADISVVDAKTKQPLVNAQITLAGGSASTGKDGKVTLEQLNPGPTMLTVSAKNYRTQNLPLKLTFGTNHIALVSLQSTGVPIIVLVTDKVSGLPLEGAEIVVDEIHAVTNSQGQGLLSLMPSLKQIVKAHISREGYLASDLTLSTKASDKLQSGTLVPAGKVHFLSNRTGRIDLYASNLDGSEQAVVLAGTGQEDGETGLLPNVSNRDYLAIVSSREGRRRDGNLVHDLFTFSTKTSQLNKIESGVGFGNKRAWIGDYLVYEYYSVENASCSQLKAYSLSSGQTSILAGSGTNGCGSLSNALKNSLLYSIIGGPNQGIYAIEPNGSSRQKIDSTPANNVVRQVKDTILYEYYDYSIPYPNSEIWKSLSLTSRKVVGLPNGPAVENNRAYVDSPGGRYTSFIEKRDGKTELYLTDGSGSNEKKLTNLGSVNQFVQWYGDGYIVFSSTKSDENALYIAATTGGMPHKVADFYLGNSRTYSGGYNPSY